VNITVPESTWRELTQRLADDISAAGKMRTPEWRAAVENVPRHVFVPRYYADDQNGHSRSWTLQEPASPDSITRWLELVYSRTTLVTQVADFADRGTQAAVSSSTKPDLMIRMLEALEVADGMRVLEIGTGTGYNAALLSHRLGAGNVFSVDVDPHLVVDARDRLARLGYAAATLAAVDGIEGLPEYAPYDRIIATCALFGVPAAWITQLRPDGLVLVHIEGPLGAGNLLALRHVAPGTVQGRFLPWWGCFMRSRATAGPFVGTPRPRRTSDAPTTRTTAVDPAQLDGGARFPFLAQLHLPHGVFRSMWRGDDGDTVTELRATDGSWVEVIREPGPEGRYRLRQAGPTPLWAQVEAAWQQWTDLGEPQWHQFGLTATPTTHRVWFGDPDGPAWPLPVPADR
jgi:methyltransferase of ATP-grasp peptide maturase system